MTRPTDRDHLFWKVAHVVANDVVTLQSFIAGLIESLREHLAFTFF
jgi:hypothetical protein